MLIIAVLSGIVGMLDCVTLKSVLIKVAKLLLNHHVPPNSVTKWELVSH